MWHNMLVRLRCRFEMMSTSRFYFSFRHEKQHTAAEVVVMLFFFFVWKAVYRQALLSLPQVVEKVHFYKTQQILYPYKNALWALRLCNRGRLLSVRPAPTLFDHLYASLHRAFGRSISASLPKPQTPSPW